MVGIVFLLKSVINQAVALFYVNSKSGEGLVYKRAKHPKPTVSYKKKGPPAVMTRGPLKEVYIS